MIAALLLAAGTLPAVDDAPDFAREIWPLLERSCVECHRSIDDDGGPKRPKGELVLTTPAAITAGGRGGRVVVPGDASASRLVHVVTLPAEDPDAMPPRGVPLSADEAARLAAWIDAGADFGDWSGATAAPPTAPDEPGARDAPERVPTRVSVWTRLAEGLAAPDTATIEAARDDDLLVEPVAGPLLRVEARRVDDTTHAHLAALAPHVTSLDLGRSDVDADDLARLPTLPRLTRVDLDRTRLGDAALEALARHPELRVVNLHATRVTDGGLAALARLPNLERLFLWDSRVTPAGAARLARERRDLAVSATHPALDAPAADDARPRR